jgi:Ca2+-transporting ATPase
VLLTIVLQLAVVYLPALNAVFKTVPLTAGQLAGAVAAAVAVFAAVEAEKWWRRRSWHAGETTGVTPHPRGGQGV